MILKVIFFTVLSLAGFSSVVAQSVTKDDGTFKSLIRQMTDAQIAYDAATLDKIFTVDYIEISPVGEVDSRQKVLGFYNAEAKLAAGTPPKLELSDYLIRSYDKFSIVILRVSYTLMSEGKPLPPRGMRVMTVFRKEKGEWKIASAQYTIIRAAPPAPPK